MTKLNKIIKLFSLIAIIVSIGIALWSNGSLEKPPRISSSNSGDVFIHPTLSYSIDIPKNWKISVEPENSINRYQPVSFLSPDYKITEEGGQSFMITGGSFNISILDLSTNIETTLNDLYDMYGNHQTIKVGEKDLIKIENCGHNDEGLCYYLVNNNNIYSFTYSQPNPKIRGTLYKDKYLGEFNEFVNSIIFPRNK
jgi:hypothetical protein